MATEITVLLNRLSKTEGDERKQAFDRLISMVYSDLRSRARQQMRGERDWKTLQPTALVHEAYGRLMSYDMTFQNREHFLNVAATAMRRLLIERARRVKAVKRGAGQLTSMPDMPVVEALTQDPNLLLDLDAALATLRPEQVQLVELRYFAGLSLEETAEAMGVKAEAVKKRWQVVKTLLYDKLRR